MGRNVVASEDRLRDDYRTFSVALAAVESKYVDKVESDRLVYSAISGMLQTLDPHSNFMDPRQYAQTAGAPGRPLLRARHHDRADRRRHHGAVPLRGVASLQAGHSPRGHHREGRWRGRQGLDERPGRAEAARSEGHLGRGVHQAIGFRGADSHQGHARRDQHPDDPRVLHGGRPDGIYPAAGFRREHRPGSRAGARGAERQRDEAPAARHPREPGRAARSGHPRGQPLPQEGRPHRLHARPRGQLRPRFQRHRGQRRTPSCRSSSW